MTSLSLTPVTSIDVPFNLLKSSQLIAVAADYATEIENAVGVEIYEPIFKAGIFIFFSGVVSSLIVAFIVSKSNAWEGLEDEFQKGKEAQFITLMGSKLQYLTIILMLVFKQQQLMPYILTCGNYFSFFTGSPEGEIRDSIQINESKDEGITTVATTKSNEEDGSSSSNIDLRNLDI